MNAAHRSLAPLTLAVVLISAATGCAPDSLSDGGDAADSAFVPDATRDPDAAVPGPDTFMDCHYDCFGGTTCVAGVFVALAHAPIPCGPRLDEALASPYGVCGYFGTKTPCVSGLCEQRLCSDDHELHEGLVGPDAVASPCFVRTSYVVGTAPKLTVGPDGAPLVEVSGPLPAASPVDGLTLTVVATLAPEDVTLGGAAATTDAIAGATLYGAGVLHASSTLPICRGALVAALAGGGEVRVVWSSSLSCYQSIYATQASCRVLHMPPDEAR